MNQMVSKYEAIVVGASAGGLKVLMNLLKALPADFALPLMIVQHRLKNDRHLLEELLQIKSKIPVKQADEKEQIQDGMVYTAPANYHLLVENDRTFSLSTDVPENFSRPSIDVLFETAAEAYKDKLIGIILTGASDDGAKGMVQIKKQGGTTIAQNVGEAEHSTMPQAAINTGCVEHIFTLKEIVNFLLTREKHCQ